MRARARAGRTTIDDQGLSKRLKPGAPVTLVLGAGVNAQRHVPQWRALVSSVWASVHGVDPFAADRKELARLRSACLERGFAKDFVNRLELREHPLELQFALEELFDSIRWQTPRRKLARWGGAPARRRGRGPGSEAEERGIAVEFARLLHRALYSAPAARATRGSRQNDTLALIARSVRKSASLPSHRRLVSQVITFNVDDLLEREVNAGCRRDRPRAVPICRASAVRPPRASGAIPVYHLHGFVPWDARLYPTLVEDGELTNATEPFESLVFTDEQYWRTVANPIGFASRVFAGALVGTCVFVGLSMTDLNVIRWLAQDAIERGDDFRRMLSRWNDPAQVASAVGDDLARHFWITTGVRSADDEDGPVGERVLKGTLGRRGVSCVIIPGWDDPGFHAWWKRRFSP